MSHDQDTSKTWPIFNERIPKGTNYHGDISESLKRANFEFIRVEDYSDLFIQVFHYEIIDSKSTIFKDGRQEPYPGGNDRKWLQQE
jgi:hypothetical protein